MVVRRAKKRVMPAASSREREERSFMKAFHFPNSLIRTLKTKASTHPPTHPTIRHTCARP